jgi:hypothetical protein
MYEALDGHEVGLRTRDAIIGVLWCMDWHKRGDMGDG